MSIMMMMMICSSEGSERGGTEGNWTSACVFAVSRGPSCGQEHALV